MQSIANRASATKRTGEYYNGNEIFLKIFVIFMSQLHFINEDMTNNGLLKLHKIFQLNRKCNIRVPYDAKLNKIHIYGVLYIISANLYAISKTDICTFIARISRVQYRQIAASPKRPLSLSHFLLRKSPSRRLLRGIRSSFKRNRTATIVLPVRDAS